MIRTFFVSTLAFLAITASAQSIQDGFYRVQNYGSKRYAYVYDCTGSINLQGTTADMGAIGLYRTAAKRLSDPASVIYISNQGQSGNYKLYDLQSQGTGVYQIINYLVSVSKGSAPDTYWVYEPKFSLYLWDSSSTTTERSGITTIPNNAKPNLKNWQIWPVSSSGDEYLGIAPATNMQLGNKYYKPYYLGFAFDFASAGMKAYYISDVKSDAVIIKEAVGTIPAATPVIVECSSANASDNRVNLYRTSITAISDNKLKGNYFCYGQHAETDRLLYNPETMRVLAVKDGKLCYVTDTEHEHTTSLTLKTGTDWYVSANESYLPVPKGTAASLPVMTQEEYDALHPATKKGDVNGDGLVNTTDVTVLYTVIAAGKNAKDVPAADVNGDGLVNTTDVTVLYTIIAAGK